MDIRKATKEELEDMNRWIREHRPHKGPGGGRPQSVIKEGPSPVVRK